uniref:Uncharacterized protein n=1 Tax=Timema monikensis TaxID=170555 RepID=A0A7R9HSI9_9NEOP|nr:unnamed protein product [Timema monikensis]
MKTELLVVRLMEPVLSEVFAVARILTYPPPPAKGGLDINTQDLINTIKAGYTPMSPESSLIGYTPMSPESSLIGYTPMSLESSLIESSPI